MDSINNDNMNIPATANNTDIKENELNKVEIRKIKLREYRRKYYKKYIEEKPDKIKQYQAKYYENNRDKFQKKNCVCVFCDYTGTSSHMRRHERTQKHLNNVIIANLKKSE